MRYFADQLAGSLTSRITAAGSAFHHILSALVWNITPPCADFLGSLAVFLVVDWRMALALLVFVSAVVAVLALFGERGRPLHHRYAEEAGATGGELVDAIANMWALKAFSARTRERDRLARRYDAERQTQVKSWRYLEKTRVIHDLALLFMAGSMLAWAIRLWSVGRITPGEVVMVSALTFRILHGSRDLALALIGTIQQFAIVGETLRIVARPHAVADRPDARPFVARGGAIELRDVTFAYPDGRTVLDRFSLQVPAGQKVGLVGPSGAGKSTLAMLVQRLDDVQSGTVLVDGQPVTAVTQDSCVPRSRPSRRRSRCSTARSWRTSATAAPTRPTRRSSPPPAPPTATASSASCRRATTPSWASAGPSSRAASASGSASRAPSSRTPRSCSSTRRPRRSIPNSRSWSSARSLG